MNYVQSLTQACEHLKLNDPVMLNIINKYGSCKIVPHTNYYEELCSSIIGQQLSVKVASIIWQRFKALYDNEVPTPEQILDTDIEKIREIGASYAKARYIKDLAAHIVSGELDLYHIATLPNNVVIDQLTRVKGIGEWSAHMFMIFSLGRLDILPWGDLGVRKSAMELYGLHALPNKSELVKLSIANKWRPYESVAAWYLWQNLDNK